MPIFVELLLLLIVANASPVVVRLLMGNWLARPLDNGLRLVDGQPLFGRKKTWRGVLAAVVSTALVGQWLELGLVFGAMFGLLAMVGDLISSFIKRRLRMKESERFRGLDQLPEAVLPLLLAFPVYNFGWGSLVAVALIFTVLTLAVSPLLYRLGLRRRPH
ncbi:MAG: CDP-archaeol synthase [Oleiphilaceae bacterium]|nr:CDP-archaeol synthase [Oleiphilaceae bacterium]